MRFYLQKIISINSHTFARFLTIADILLCLAGTLPLYIKCKIFVMANITQSNVLQESKMDEKKLMNAFPLIL